MSLYSSFSLHLSRPDGFYAEAVPVDGHNQCVLRIKSSTHTEGMTLFFDDAHIDRINTIAFLLNEIASANRECCDEEAA